MGRATVQLCGPPRSLGQDMSADLRARIYDLYTAFREVGWANSTAGFNASANLWLSGGPSDRFYFQASSVSGVTASPDFNVSQTYSLLANVVYQVILQTDIDGSAANPNGSTSVFAKAFVDPMFTIDPSFGDYSILLSDGVGNALASTPIPAALPLFATGLGAMGFIGWRRKRKAAAALAA